MSEYGYLVCDDCRVQTFLGKAVKRPDDSINYYLIGDQEPNWQQSDVSRALWKMLADHTGHKIAVVREFSQEYQDWTADMDANGLFAAIGGDSVNDIPYERYLADWPG